MLSGRPVGENWIISSSSDREAAGASATLWLGMRVMGPPVSPGAAAPGQSAAPGLARFEVTGKDGAAAGNVTSGPAMSRSAPLARPYRQGPRSPSGQRSARERGQMSESTDGAKIVQAYRDHRPYLIDLAFRMLGDIGAAEDAVQDAFTRLLAADVGAIEDERGWLIVVTSR